MKNREQLLRNKETEVEAWARETGILKVGEKIRVSIRVLRLGNRYDYRVARELTPQDWDKIFSYPWKRGQREVLGLIHKNGNQPTHADDFPGGMEILNSVFSKARAEYRLIFTEKESWSGRIKITVVAY